MPHSARYAALAGVLFAAVACGLGPQAGEWTGTLAIKPGPGQNPLVAHSLSMVHLKVDPLGSFELLWEGLTYQGQASSDHLDAVTTLGQPMPHPLTFHLLRPGGVLTLVGPDGAAAALIPKVAH